MRRKWLVLGPLVLLGFAAFVAIGVEIVKLLWNWLTPVMFGWPAITFWQAFGLLVLCRILFGGFGARGFSRPHRVPDKIRERLRQRMQERWGMEPPADAGQGS